MSKEINLKNTVLVLLALIFFIPIRSSYADYDSFTVNIPNDQGGYTAIVVKKSGEGYTGPQGEYYPEFPTVYQLQNMYRTGAPNPTPVVTYAEAPQPEVQEVAYQQGPPPDNFPPQENVSLTFFDFKKNKKSNPPPVNNQHTTNNNPQPLAKAPNNAPAPKSNGPQNKNLKTTGNNTQYKNPPQQ